MQHLAAAVRAVELAPSLGQVARLSGLMVESIGPDCAIGDVCELRTPKRPTPLRAEVVALQGERVILMPFGDTAGIGRDCEVEALGPLADVPVGDALLGRVVDAFGEPLDGLPRPLSTQRQPVKGSPTNPMQRPPVRDVLETGVRCIDALFTLGRGQRMGIFSGSGVGKSTLLGMIARHVRADVNVIALIGERGRELRAFIDKSLGQAGLARSVVVVATSDQPAAVRVRAAHAATAIAEHFRGQGRHVLLTMDSVTRFAMARREIGLAVGEPATARGYTPSVFADLPRLLERCGTAEGGGSITALYTVLVEGDDMNDPISDALRSILDGHLVLSRKLANQGHYPSIDVLPSVSRLLPELASAQEAQMARHCVAQLAAYDKSHAMVEIGAYRAGANPALDKALKLVPQIDNFCRQAVDAPVARADALRALRTLLAAEGVA
jgi:flagellum-specific ATP synthase